MVQNGHSNPLESVLVPNFHECQNSSTPLFDSKTVKMVRLGASNHDWHSRWSTKNKTTMDTWKSFEISSEVVQNIPQLHHRSKPPHCSLARQREETGTTTSPLIRSCFLTGAYPLSKAPSKKKANLVRRRQLHPQLNPLQKDLLDSQKTSGTSWIFSFRRSTSSPVSGLPWKPRKRNLVVSKRNYWSRGKWWDFCKWRRFP